MQAKAARDDAERACLASLRREQRLAQKAQKAIDNIGKVTTQARTVDEWAAPSLAVRRKAAHQRDRDCLHRFMSSHTFRAADIADVLQTLGVVDELFNKTRLFFDLYFKKVKELVTTLEQEHYGLAFGLFMHFDIRVTMPKLLNISQMASKAYEITVHRYP